jgi:EAL domain-containing protein (putative c-di-GMP-specific phosphodiesterase class I)
LAIPPEGPDHMATSLLTPDGRAWELDLPHALHRGEFTLVYQPIVRLDTAKVEGMEALIRWEHPTLGTIPPADFIPAAERGGWIVQIGEWALREACREYQRWQSIRQDCQTLRLNVNISAKQFQQSSFARTVRDILDETCIAPHALRLEITETTLMADVQTATATMLQLKKQGITLAVDDFGTGHSSLLYLKEFPVDCIKIDRAFTAGLGRDAKDEAIVRSVLTLAKALGLEVTAEGVETLEQVEYLRQLGCESGQGYLFARPLTPDQVAAWLSRAVA